MRVIVGGAQRGPAIASTAIVGALIFVTFAIVTGAAARTATVVLGVTALAAVVQRALFSWRFLFSFLLVVILFIPIQRYKLPGHLPFDLEPYRLVVAFLLLAWLSSLLIDPRVKLRASGLETPIVLIVVAILGSIVANGSRIQALAVSSDVVKTFTFYASYFLVFFFVLSVVRTRDDVHHALKLLVGGGAVIGVLAVVEARTGYSPFEHLSSIFPFLKPLPFEALQRNGERRAFGPAQHPIALGALLIMLVPPALYIAYATKKKLWWLAAVLVVVGAFSTVSRTTVVMVFAVALVFVLLRPTYAKRFWPALIPVLLAIHFAVPGTLGTLKASLFPKGGLIASQKVHPDSQSSAGRIADIAPSLHELAPKPLFGLGLGTRITTGPRANDRLLDDQWLGTLLDTGIAGIIGWAWLMLRFIRRAGTAAKHDYSERGWLLVATVAPVAAFGAGMFLFDAFSFIQVNFLFFILMALGSVALNRVPGGGTASATRRAA
jgi:hypothetical protein